MKTFALYLLFVISALIVGCADETPNSDYDHQETYDICTPSDHPSYEITLQITKSAGGFPIDYKVLYNLGTDYLFVDNHCFFWAFDTSGDLTVAGRHTYLDNYPQKTSLY